MSKLKSFSLVLLVGIMCFSFILANRVSAQGGDGVVLLNLSKSGHEEAHSISFSSDGNYLAAGGTAGIYLFDLKKLSQSGLIPTGSWARSLAFVPGTDNLAAGMFDSTVKFWAIPALDLMQTLEGPKTWVRSISISNDGSLIASASDDDVLHVWNISDGSPVLKINTNTTGLRAAAISPDGKLVAGALGDKTVRVWSVPAGELVYTLQGHEDWVRNLAFSPDGSLLASGSFDKNIMLWNMQDGSLYKILPGHTSSILSLAFSPDGKTLASGSVDETIRLWSLDDGQTVQLIKSGQGFVYSVAFSPDGKTLASGGQENSVRLWNLGVYGQAPAGQDLTGPEVSSDCRHCHHPRASVEPPLVAHMSCETCHADGASLSWCPIFPRSIGAKTTLVMASTVPTVGIPVGAGDTAVVISSPANGETLYSNRKYTVPAVISGKVYASAADLAGLKVQLELWNDEKLFLSESVPVKATGMFDIVLTLNPSGEIPVSTKPSALDCVNCHDESDKQKMVPGGAYRLKATVTTADGHVASDERWIKVDVSQLETLMVKTTDSSTGKPVAGLPVQAKTYLYEWKGQYARGISAQSGQAGLNLEKLSLADTSYILTIPPYAVNGVLYAGDEPVQVNLAPGQNQPAPITIKVHAQPGEIKGSIANQGKLSLAAGLPVWAVQLPAGPAYRTQLGAEGEFVFENIPVSQYLVTLDQPALAGQNLAMAPGRVDLLAAPVSNLSFSLEQVSSLSGSIRAAEGDFLPFAWVRTGDHAAVLSANPANGTYLVPDLAKNQYVTVSSPGYYSQLKSVQAAQNALDFELAPRPDTRRAAWGDGFVVVPPEMVGSVKGLDFTVVSGWLWGQAVSAAEPVSIHLPGLEIEVQNGKFALESPANGQGWLYVYQGKALLTYANNPAVEVNSGQMMALRSGAAPMTMEPAVAFALNPGADKAPVMEIIEPTVSARIQSWLVKTGIGAMQTITYITYLLSLVILIVIPLAAIYWYLRRKPK